MMGEYEIIKNSTEHSFYLKHLNTGGYLIVDECLYVVLQYIRKNICKLPHGQIIRTHLLERKTFSFSVGGSKYEIGVSYKYKAL